MEPRPSESRELRLRRPHLALRDRALLLPALSANRRHHPPNRCPLPLYRLLFRLTPLPLQPPVSPLLPGLVPPPRLRARVNIVLRVGLAAFASAAVGYVVERLDGREFVKSQTMEGTVPSYLMREQLTTGEMLEHPTYTLPTLRSYDFPLSMPHHLFQPALTSLAVLNFVSIFRSLSPLPLALLASLLVAIASSLVQWDVMPVTSLCAFSVGAALAARAGWAAAVVGWVVEELRKEKKVRKVELLLVYEETDEVLAVGGARVEGAVPAAGRRRRRMRRGPRAVGAWSGGKWTL